MFELITTYDLAVENILREISVCGNGDRIVICLYLWEPGKSSDLIIKELDAAAERGVQITIDIDCSRVSRFARFVEHTESFADNIKKLQKKYPQNVRYVCETYPNHSKFYLFEHGSGDSTLMFGGMNLGDRFADWKDFLVKVKALGLGKYVYDRFISGERHSNENLPLRIVANEPKKKIFEIENALKKLLEDKRFCEYTVISPYIDHRGIELLSEPLHRNASVRLIIPMRPNIYRNANMRNLSGFATLPNVTVFMYKKMIHAKAVLANGDRKVCFLGSANLKKNSFDKLGEFNGLIDDTELNNKLSDEINNVLKSCIPFSIAPYRKIMSRLEEFLG